jgi:hypothetical protein
MADAVKPTGEVQQLRGLLKMPELRQSPRGLARTAARLNTLRDVLHCFGD